MILDFHRKIIFGGVERMWFAQCATWSWPLWISSLLAISKNENKYFYSHSYLWPVKTRPTAVSETSSANSRCTPCKNPKTKKNNILLFWLRVLFKSICCYQHCNKQFRKIRVIFSHQRAKAFYSAIKSEIIWGILYRSLWPGGIRGREDLRSLACWDCCFEPRRGHGCLSLLSVVCCQVEVSATGRSPAQRSHTDCGVSLSVMQCTCTHQRQHLPWDW